MVIPFDSRRSRNLHTIVVHNTQFRRKKSRTGPRNMCCASPRVQRISARMPCGDHTHRGRRSTCMFSSASCLTYTFAQRLPTRRKHRTIDATLHGSCWSLVRYLLPYLRTVDRWLRNQYVIECDINGVHTWTSVYLLLTLVALQTVSVFSVCCTGRIRRGFVDWFLSLCASC